MNNDYNAIYNEEVASKCVYGKSFVWEVLNGYNYDNIFIKSIDRPMSHKKIEGFKKLAENRLYYQKNPVQFLKDFFQIQLVDSQAFLFQMAWLCPNVLIVASRAYGKSFWISLFCMAKQMLSSDPWNCYIASGSSQQSATTFKKIEDIANDNISSLIGANGHIFKDEIEVKNAAGDGFNHSSSGHTYNLFNGSFCKTLSSNVDRARGARSECVIFDEVGFLDADLIHVYGAFVAVSENFVTGFDESGNEIDVVRSLAKPKGIPRQKIYVSSASSTDTEFYKLYRDFSKRMLMGDKNYFVAHIDCDLVMSPTIHNVPTTPALSRDQIDAAMRSNPEKARREYYCEFTTDAGSNAIIRRGTIARNEVVRKPILYNDTGERKIVITYDPARSRDNSVILVSEIYKDKDYNGEMEYKMRILNCINLIDIEKKNKTPMRTPDQIKYLKQVILDYNNGGDDAYSNILGIYIDAGSGGSGVNLADYLMEDWVDDSGKKHRGLIDKEYSEEYAKNFPNAVNKVHLMSPSKYKSEMYEAMIELIDQDKIEFTSTYDNKGYLTVVEIDKEKTNKEKKKIIDRLKKKKLSDEEIEIKLQEELSNIQNAKTRIEELSWQEEISLSSIDALKEELVNMVRIKRESGKDSFELAPEKRNKMHDDRAYTMAMASYALQQERRKKLKKKPKKNIKNIADLLVAQTKTSTRKIGIFN